MKIVLQHDECDCGAACLAMISGSYGLRLPISKCRKLTKTSRSGTNLLGIVNGAEEIGLKADALSGEPDELLDGIRKKEITLPFIAHTVSENQMLHFVVVQKYRKGKFIIADPAVGKRTLTEQEFFERWTGYVACFSKTETFKRGNECKGTYTKFWMLLKGQGKTIGGILAFSFLVAGIGIAGAFVFQIVMNTISAGQDADTFIKLNRIFGGLLVLYLLQAVIQMVRSYLLVSMAQKLDIKISMMFYEHLMNLPISSILLRQTGDYLSRLSDTETIRQAVSGATLTIVMDSFMVVFCGGILFHQNERLFFISLGIIFIYGVIVAFYRKPIARKNKTTMEKNAVVQSYFKESIEGAETIKAAGAVSEVKEKAFGNFRKFAEAAFQSSMLSISQETLTGSVEMIGVLGILWMGFQLVLFRKITTGELLTFYALLSYFTEPIKNLIQLQPEIQTAVVAADRLNDILMLETEPVQCNGKKYGSFETFEFRNVDFRYGNGERILKNVDFKFSKGEKIAIVGESGSGKTSLAKLMMRFYSPEQGGVFVDGINVEEISMETLRKKIAYVSQNTFLFADTLKNNLLLGNREQPESEIEKACKMSCVEEFAQELPMGYDTPIDENGMNLSGGQRQRIAIARALLRKPELLILDEATSNLDTMTECRIRDAIWNQKNDMTCLMIAHRLSTIRDCDRIYVMDKGEIVEQGTHEELIRQNGLYAKLWKAQT